MMQAQAAAPGSPAAVTARLAEFAQTLQWQDLPAVVQREAVRAFLNWVGCAVGGARSASAETTMRGLLAMSGPGITPALGRAERLQPADAALANCLASAADTFDDTHLSTITHPTGPVAAAVLALADGRKISGQALLLALAIGIEIECRISAAITAAGSGASQGWYITGVSGGIGAAAAAGRLLGSGPAAMISTLGLAATQASGFRATHGNMSVAFVPGIAARNGLAAAHLAAAGFTCSEAVIEGRNGLLQVLAPQARPEAVTEGLGSRFEMLGNAYKPYPCGIVIHASIDACLALAGRCAAEAIERVELAVHADTMALCWRKLPATTSEAQVSLYHWTAAALLRGAAGLAEGEAAAVADPAIRALQERMQAEVDPSLASGQARVTLRLRDGSSLDHSILETTGSLERPMSDAQLAAKFRMLAGQRLGPAQVERLLEACLQLPDSADAGAIGRLGALAQI